VTENPFEEHSSSKKAARDKHKVITIDVLCYLESLIDRRILDKRQK